MSMLHDCSVLYIISYKCVRVYVSFLFFSCFQFLPLISLTVVICCLLVVVICWLVENEHVFDKVWRQKKIIRSFYFRSHVLLFTLHSNSYNFRNANQFEYIFPFFLFIFHLIWSTDKQYRVERCIILCM